MNKTFSAEQNKEMLSLKTEKNEKDLAWKSTFDNNPRFASFYSISDLIFFIFLFYSLSTKLCKILLIIEISMAAPTDARNPVISKLGTNKSVNCSTAPLMTNKNNPIVIIVTGSANNFKIGFTVTFKIPKITAANINAAVVPILMLSTQRSTINNDTPLQMRLRNIFFIVSPTFYFYAVLL